MGEGKDLVAGSFWAGRSDLKPEQLFAVDVCFHDNDHNSEVSSALLVQHTAKWVRCGSNVSKVQPPTAPFPLWMTTHHATTNNSQALSLANSVCCSQQITHDSQQTQTRRRPRRTITASSSYLFNIVTREKTFPSSDPACPPSWRICTGNQTESNHLNRFRASWLFIVIHTHPYTPSLTRSKTSLTSKLISSVSWPTYWYIARQRGPCGRGCGLGAGGGRWLMLLFLCFLW